MTPILITGPHRSGTTWIGHVLATDPSVGYIHEPFTLISRPGCFSYRVPYWYYAVPEPAPPAIVASYEHLLQFRYSFADELPAIRSPRDAARMLRDAAHFLQYRVQKRRPLIKDPLALLSAGWLARTFRSAVLVSSRHPLAFVSSVMHLGWRFDFTNLTRQKEVMGSLLADSAGDIERGATLGANDPIVEAAYLWKVLHRVIDRYRQTQKDWLFVRYEDLARDPVNHFAEIFPKLGLDFTDRIRQRIEYLSGHGNPEERAPKDPRVTRVASSTHAVRSTQRLGAEDRERVKEIVAPVSQLFYADSDW